MAFKLRALIVDDEENARLLLQRLLEELRVFSEIRLAQSSSDAISELLEFEPDVVFLDIKMPGRDGFDFINDLPGRIHKPAIVFVTAYDEYAIKAIKNQAFDYLLKPVNRIELSNCVQRILGEKQQAVSEKDSPGRIRINTRTGTVFLDPETILYCRANGNYTTICTGTRQHLCSLNLGKVEEMLPAGKYSRLGRSHIINRVYLTVLDRKESTITLVRGSEEVTLKVPRQYLAELDSL